MQATGALLSFRRLASKIHPQLPLTAQESQQLLNILSSSFRQHLDQHHPVGNPPAKDTTVASGEQDARQTISSQSPTVKYPHSYNATDEHFSNILTSPLLAKKPRSASLSEASTAESIYALIPPDSPLNWIEQRIANANVTVDDVYACLASLWRRRDNLKELGAASKILAWLRASGQISESALLASHHMRKLYNLTNMLVLEGRQDIIIGWLKREASDTTRRGPLMFYIYLQSECKHGSGLEGVMRIISGMSPQFLSKNDLIGRSIWNAVFPQLPNKAHLVDANVYESFATRLASSSWSQKIPFDATATLELFHPTTPSHEKSLEYVDRLSRMPDPTSSMSPSVRRMHVRICLRLGQLLISHKQYESAKHVLRFTQEHFAREIGGQPSGRQLSKAERENLQELDGLILG